MSLISEEVWLPVVGYEGIYSVSSHGRILSHNYNRTGVEQVMSLALRGGYWCVGIWKNAECKQTYVHILVATAFVPNPLNKPQVHHKDHNRSNAYYKNLEWTTQSENLKYNYTEGGKVGKTNMKGRFGVDNPRSVKVRMLSIEGSLIKILDGVNEAARFVDGDPSHIVKACRGKIKYHKGYKWQYL